MTTARAAGVTNDGGGKMLFLVSHGLQSPLSAIRWGCGRLKRMAKNLSAEERKVLDDIHGNAKLVSEMVDALLLLAKLDDGVYVPRLEDIYLKDLLLTGFLELPTGAAPAVVCDDALRLRTDRTIFEASARALFIAAVSAAGDKEVAIEAMITGDSVTIAFNGPLHLSLVEDAESPEMPASLRRIVGGVPGMMLAVAAGLATGVGGTVEAHEDRGITLRLPVKSSVSVLPEA